MNAKLLLQLLVRVIEGYDYDWKNHIPKPNIFD